MISWQTASPHISQALYIAGLAFVHEIKQGMFQGTNDQAAAGAAVQGTAFLQVLAQQNLDVIINALRKMERYWAGAGVARHILEQRASGLGYSRIDFSKVGENIPTFISLPDSGILKRFTGDLGLNSKTRPNRECCPLADCQGQTSAPRTSLPPWRLSVRALRRLLPERTAYRTVSGVVSRLTAIALLMDYHHHVDQFMLQNLLSQYSVDEMLVEPAGTFDPSLFNFDFAQ